MRERQREKEEEETKERARHKISECKLDEVLRKGNNHKTIIKK